MRPDISREILQGWAVAVGAVFLAGISLYIISDGGALATQVDQEQAALKAGDQDLARLVALTERANDSLEQTLDTLKRQVGFNTEDAFQVAADPEFARQPGYYFVLKRNSIIDRLRKRAHEKGIRDYEEYAGFGVAQHRPPAETVPGNDEALDLLRILQITDKAVSICLETPAPLERLLVKPHGVIKPVEIAAPDRPALLKEYRITLDVRGSLRDILWILHRLSPGRDAPEADYPLVLKSLKITSENRSPLEGIQQIDCTITVAGMRFLSDAERNAGDKKLVVRRERMSTSDSINTQARNF